MRAGRLPGAAADLALLGGRIRAPKQRCEQLLTLLPAITCCPPPPFLPPACLPAATAERDELLSEGFSNWMRRDFNAFVRACEKYGRNKLAEIAADIETKTEEEVRRGVRCACSSVLGEGQARPGQARPGGCVGLVGDDRGDGEGKHTRNRVLLLCAYGSAAPSPPPAPARAGACLRGCVLGALPRDP